MSFKIYCHNLTGELQDIKRFSLAKEEQALPNEMESTTQNNNDMPLHSSFATFSKALEQTVKAGNPLAFVSKIAYRDPENDLISISSQLEWAEFLRLTPGEPYKLEATLQVCELLQEQQQSEEPEKPQNQNKSVSPHAPHTPHDAFSLVMAQIALGQAPKLKQRAPKESKVSKTIEDFFKSRLESKFRSTKDTEISFWDDIPSQENQNQNIPNQNIPNQIVQNQNVQNQNVQNQNVQNQNVQNRTKRSNKPSQVTDMRQVHCQLMLGIEQGVPLRKTHPRKNAPAIPSLEKMSLFSIYDEKMKALDRFGFSSENFSEINHRKLELLLKNRLDLMRTVRELSFEYYRFNL